MMSPFLSVVSLVALLGACSGDDEAAQPTAPVAVAPAADVAKAKAEAKAQAEAEAAAKAAAQGTRAAPADPKAPEGGLQLAAAGHHAAAVGALEQELTSDGSDAARWRALEREAVAAGQAAALLARLDAGDPLGGKAGPHHLLRSALQLSLGKASQAFDSATMAAGEDAAGAAGAQALAILAGARLPAQLSRVDPDAASAEDALLRLAAARSATEAARWSAKAAEVSGHRAALARGMALARLDMVEDAQAAYAAAVSSGDPRGAVAGGLAIAALVRDQGDDAAALEQAGKVAAAAAADGDAAGTAAALQLALEVAIGDRRPDAAVAPAVAAADVLAAQSGGGVPAEVGVLACRIGLLGGRPAEVLGAAQLAVLSLPEGPAAQAGAAQAGAVRALAAAVAFEVGDPKAAVRIAAGAEDGPAAVIAANLQGHRDRVVDLGGLSPVDAALVGLTAVEAHIPAADRARVLQAAAAAALRSDLPPLILRTHLAWESAARAAGSTSDAAAARRTIAGAFPSPTAQLQAELALRAQLAGGADSLPADAVPVWHALETGAAPPAEGSGIGQAIAPWASARAMAMQGKAEDAAKAYLDALGSVPAHRFGRLSTGSALDGSQGVPVRWELEQGKTLEPGPAATVVFSAHELLHRVNDTDRQVQAGRNLVDGLPPTLAEPLLDTAAAARVAVAGWLLGGDAPDLEAFRAAETAALAHAAMARLAPATGRSAADLILGEGSSALISLLPYGGRLHGAALSPKGFLALDLGPAASLETAARAHARALATGSPAGTTGNKVRDAIIDPFSEQLSGVPRYVVVGPPAFQAFGIATVPEQSSALRWLEDIRDVSVVPTLTSMVQPDITRQPYAPDLLALAPPAPPPEPGKAQAEGGAEKASLDEDAADDAGADAAGDAATDAAADDAADEAETDDAADDAAAPGRAKADRGKAKAGKAKGGKAKGGKATLDDYEELLPGELIRGAFQRPPGMPQDLDPALRNYAKGRRQLLAGADSTVAAWAAGAPTARVIQISGVQTAPGGGFALGDGVVGLDDIRTTPMQAELVLLMVDAPVEVQLARAHAFIDAGVERVVVQAWSVPEPAKLRYAEGLYDAINQERPLARAMEVARQSVKSDPLREEQFSQPGVWGAWILVGRP